MLKTFEQEKIDQSLRFIKLYLTRRAIFYRTPGLETDTTYLLKDLESVLKLSNEFSKENNSKLYFIYLPLHSRYVSANNNDNFMKYKEVIEIIGSLNITIIDLNKELFDKHNDPLSLFPFSMDGHYNIKGYQLVAETIFNKIILFFLIKIFQL